MPTIRLQAIDTLFFRDGRPFTMGDDSWANTLFPPSPTTAYGFLRAVYFNEHIAEHVKANTNNDPTKNLNIIYYGLEWEQDEKTEKLYPLPLDIVMNEDDKSFHILKLFENNNKYNDQQLSCKLLPGTELSGKKIRSTKGEYYITEDELKTYLNGNTVSSPVKLSSLLTNEPKIGISRDRRNAENKKLYRINQIRPQSDKGSVNFLLTYNGMKQNLQTGIYRRFGGEAKQVFVEKIEDNTNENLHHITDMPVFINNNDDDDNVIVKMYLASPAVFKKGWKPELNNDLKIVAAVIGNPIHIGGWDMKNRRPKKMVQAVPAGSVYYIKGKTEYINKFIAEYHGKKLPQIEENYHKQGYGLVYFSKVINNHCNTKK
jgi:CRISPR-associated protein Cmr3